MRFTKNVLMAGKAVWDCGRRANTWIC